MRRRSVARLLLIGTVVGASGCAGAERSGSSGTVPRVGFISQNAQANYALEMVDGFRSAVHAVGGVEAVVSAPDVVDGQAQLALFEKMTADNSVRAVGLHTAFGELFAQPMADVIKRGVPVISVDSRPPPSSNVRLFVGNDNRELGRQLADKIIDKLPADVTGTIVIGNTTPGTHALDQRSDGMRERIRERLPAVKVTGPFETKRDPQVNLASWTTVIDAHPRALAFLGTGNFDSVSLAALRKPGVKWLAGGFDLEPKALAAVKSGDLTLMSPEHFVKGAIAGRLAARFAKNGTAVPEGFLVVPGLAVTTDNIDELTARQASADARTAYAGPVIDKLLSDPAAMRPLP